MPRFCEKRPLEPGLLIHRRWESASFKIYLLQCVIRSYVSSQLTATTWALCGMLGVTAAFAVKNHGSSVETATVHQETLCLRHLLPWCSFGRCDCPATSRHALWLKVSSSLPARQCLVSFNNQDIRIISGFHFSIHLTISLFVNVLPMAMIM